MTVSLSLPALTGEAVYDLNRETLYNIAVNSAAGFRWGFCNPTHLVERAKQYAKEQELVFEQHLLASFCDALAKDAANRFTSAHTFDQIKRHYELSHFELSTAEKPDCMK